MKKWIATAIIAGLLPWTWAILFEIKIDINTSLFLTGISVLVYMGTIFRLAFLATKSE